MRCRLRLVGSITVAVLLLAGPLAGVARAQLGVNLIPDPSFESVISGLPEDWFVESGSPAGVEISDDRPKTGSSCLEFVSDPTNDTWLRKSTLVPVQAGSSYRLSMAYRMEEVTGAPSGRIYLRLIYHDDQGQEIGYQQMPYGQVSSGHDPQVSNAWILSQGEIVPGAGAAYVALRLEPSAAFEGRVAVDDVSLVQLVRASLSAPPGSLAFDFVDAGGASAAPGFTPVPIDRDFAVTGDHGFEPWWPSSGVVNVHGSYPSTLQGQNVRRATFKAAVPNGDYAVSLYMGGYWRVSVGFENHKVDFNGQRLVDEDTATNDLMDQLYFGSVHGTLVTPDSIARRGYAVFDEYIAPRYRRHDVIVGVTDGVLAVDAQSGLMAGVVITPLAQQAAHEAALDAFDAQLPDEFVSYWATYRPPEEFGLPVVEGSHVPGPDDLARGYVIFRRHWMEFVELDSRPDPADVGTSMSIFATPGEFEPVTFGVWPLQDLDGVTITATDLTTPSGRVIPSEAVRIWYLQQKPARDPRPATSFSFIGTFLPDWDVRDLYQDVTQRVWINVAVPEDARAGAYQGQLTFTPTNAPPISLDLAVQVLSFKLSRPERLHVMRRAGNDIIIPYDSSYPFDPQDPEKIRNREFYRQAAYRDLYDHGFMPEIAPWFTGWFDRSSGSMDWAMGTISGSADDQLDQLIDSPFGEGNAVWIDAANLSTKVLEAFGPNPDPQVWTIADTDNWLSDVDAKLSGLGFSQIWLHTTAEESHYGGEGTDLADAWIAFLQHVRDNRGSWPNVFTAHTCNTSWGQPLAISNADLPGLGMYHGVTSPEASQQVAEAQASGQPFLLYGARGRFVPGFYLWKAKARGSFHEFYAPFQGALNNDWDNSPDMDGNTGQILNEAPGWSNVTYSPTGRMIGSWFWEEMREGVDDDAYLTTLESWILVTAGDSRPEVVAARNAAIQVRDLIAAAIDLDVDTTLTDPLDQGGSGSYSRMGLNLYRPLTGQEMDALRWQAAQAITSLKSARGVPCGIGYELAPLLGLLMWRRRRQR